MFFTFSNLHFLALGVGFTAFTQRFACLTALSTVANSRAFCAHVKNASSQAMLKTKSERGLNRGV